MRCNRKPSRMGSPSVPMAGMWQWGQSYPGKHFLVLLKVILICFSAQLWNCLEDFPSVTVFRYPLDLQVSSP